MSGAALAVAEPSSLELRFHPRQSDALLSPAGELCFGGAAGGGKSVAIRQIAILYALECPGIQIYIFRRTYQRLIDSHVKGPRGFLALLEPLIADGFARPKNEGTIIEFENGSRIRLCHCQNDEDAWNYASAEFHLLLIDELTEFTDTAYRVLRARVRCVGLPDAPSPLRSTLPRMIGATNPVGIGAAWVKRAWIDPAPPFRVWRAPTKEGGMLRQYIPSRIEDNPNLLVEDPGYADRLSGLGTPAYVEALLEGKWGGVVGGAVSDLLEREVHLLPRLDVPKSWKFSRSLDWGSSRPFAVYWWAESDGETPIRGLWGWESAVLPSGSLIAVAEWYGWNGQANEGSKLPAVVVGRGIADREREAPWAGRVYSGPADDQIFQVHNATSIANDFSAVGIGWKKAIKGPGSRATNLQKVRAMLRAAVVGRKNGKVEEPCLLFSDACVHALRTLETLPTDKSNPEVVDDAAEDHAFDSIAYRATWKPEENVTAQDPLGMVVGV